MSEEKGEHFPQNEGDFSEPPLSSSWVQFETEIEENSKKFAGGNDNISPLPSPPKMVGRGTPHSTASHGSPEENPGNTVGSGTPQVGPESPEKKDLESMNVTIPKPPQPKAWVRFAETKEIIPTEKESPSKMIVTQGSSPMANTKTAIIMANHDDSPAVIPAESVQITLERSFSSSGEPVTNNNNKNVKPMRNVELPVAAVEPIRQGFSNGDIIVTLLPVNSRFPWVTPAVFRPELVPEELMAQGLTLTVEEYVQAMELLVNDVRFNLYNVCYKRVLVVWISIAFIVLLSLLFSGTNGLTLFGLGIGWLVLNAAAIFLSMYLKFKLQRNLERCLAHVNKQLLRHKIVIALDDRGKISCHKVNLCFIYLDSAPCIAHLQTSIDQQERDPSSGWEQRMDINAGDIVIQGSRTTRLSRKQERATLLYLRYAARWGRDRVRGLLVSPPAAGGRHCGARTCPCQYVEEHLRCKPTGSCCFYSTDPNVHSEIYASMHLPTFPRDF